MKTETFSDHTRDKAQEALAKRQADFAADLRAYEEAAAFRQELKDGRRGQLHEAWRQHQWWLLIRALFTLWFGRLPPVPAVPAMRAAGHDEARWEKGGEGEQRVRDHLARVLSDEWTLIMGYKNAKGEIDQVLIGPTGVAAIEIKYVNGVVHCDGDRWWRDKYDRYGNRVETGIPIADKGGRGPSRQVNESADCLQQYLRRRIGDGRVRRLVVLSHDGSKLGQTVNVTVDQVTTLNGWNVTHTLAGETLLDSAGVRRLTEALREHHTSEKRSPSTRSHARPTA